MLIGQLGPSSFTLENRVQVPPTINIPEGPSSIAQDPATGGTKGLSPDRYDLIPPKALEYLALVYGQACQDHGGKYAARNWERGYPWGWSARALFKHAWAFMRGEWLDPESHLPHLAHAAWHCFTLMTYHEYALGTDDRTHVGRPVTPIHSENCAP